MGEPYIPLVRPKGAYDEERRRVGGQLRRWREFNNMSLRRLRMTSQVPISSIVLLERGEQDVQLETLMRLALALVPEGDPLTATARLLTGDPSAREHWAKSLVTRFT
jgi:transcriptional regulator with XRE-family HTH domain